MKANRQHEEQCAARLVALLVARHQLPIDVTAVRVAQNWKVKFTFKLMNSFSAFDFHYEFRTRYGRRPGLEICWPPPWKLHWGPQPPGVGDVDAWQYAGDAVSGFMHGWQIVRKRITGREERPSKLLALVEHEMNLTPSPEAPASGMRPQAGA